MNLWASRFRISKKIYLIANKTFRKAKSMTKLGAYFFEKSVSKAEVARKTGLSKARLSELSMNPKTRLQAEELYKIALAMGVNPCDLLDALFGDVKLETKK
jgi:DNA-binding Xre family transcriptional regulator